MVEAMYRHEAQSTEHAQWLQSMQSAWAHPEGRVEAAALIVDGPLEQRMDGAATEIQSRQKTLACALLEAALFEAKEWPTEGAAVKDAEGADMGLPPTERVQLLLRDWLKLGAWRANEKSPLTEIGRMIERSSENAEDASATRLGLLVPFWSSLTLWRLLSDVPRAVEA